MSDADIDYIESELSQVSQVPRKYWPPTSGQKHLWNVYQRLESLRTPAPAPAPDPPPTPPPASGRVLFDGRAAVMSELVGHEVSSSQPYTNGPVKWTDGTTHYFYLHQTPAVWMSGTHTGINFIKDNISLQDDPRYGKVYRATAKVGDSNAWQMTAFLAQQKASAQVAVGRTLTLGTIDYYAFAVRVDAWTDPQACQWADIISVGYQTAANDQIAFALKYDSTHGFHYSIQSNAGYGNDATTNPQGTTFYRDQVKPVTFGVWEEFVVGVKWATDKTGWVQVHNRVPGGANTWKQLYEKTGIDTQFYGTSPNGTFPQTGDRGVVDKLGIYYGVYPAGTTQTMTESGLSRCTDLATAQAVFPA